MEPPARKNTTKADAANAPWRIHHAVPEGGEILIANPKIMDCAATTEAIPSFAHAPAGTASSTFSHEQQDPIEANNVARPRQFAKENPWGCLLASASP